MKKTILLTIIGLFFAAPSLASSFGQDLAGTILLQVQAHGEAWYVHPDKHTRHYLKDGEAAYTIMRFLSLGISDGDLALIPSVVDTTEMNTSSSACSSNSLANRLKGNILLQVEQNGEAWYIDVEKCRRIYLKDGEAAYDVMRFLGLGITNADLNKVTIAQDSVLPEGVEAPDPVVTKGSHELKTISANGKDISVDLVTIDLSTPGLEIITDSANDTDCDNGCVAQSLDEFVSDNNGFAGINGSYFCPISYSGCATKTNYFFFPVFDSDSGNFINDDQLLYPTTGPLWIFDQSNQVHIVESTLDFGSVAEFEALNNIKIQAAIGNLPLLIVDGTNVVGSQILDDKQRNTPSSRGGIAVKGDTLYLMIAHSATVVDVANIMKALNVDQGMNLDGGGSSALYFEDDYKVGPGRDIPNAIIIR
jgi:exopolysaccharide biosynthesis protein